MRIVVASNIGNGIGLQKDYELLRNFLEELGHEVEGQQFDKPAIEENFDLGIWIETISEHLIPIARKWWYFANCEWLRAEYVRPIQRHCEKVFAKTRDAEKELRQKFSNVHYVGFLTEDKMDESVPREKKFLHLGGNGGHRGTNQVISAWREYRYWNGIKAEDAPLTVVSNSSTVERVQGVPGVTFIKRATDEEVKHLQNSHLFHILPSSYEGFGHALHEAQSVGAVILTTDAPPMNEMGAPFHVVPDKVQKLNFGALNHVSAKAIREIVPKMLEQPSHEIARFQSEARARFEKGNQEFKDLFTKFVGGHGVQGEPATGFSCVSPRETPSGVRIAMIGNFGPPFSTENDLLWTLRDMGHSVIPFQENEDSTEQILSGCAGVKLLIYISTHGWRTPGKMSIDDLLVKLKAQGTITASFHLDRYWGLNELDQRENRIGQHPFWHTDFVFTADGGNQDRFREALGSDRHRWLPPGVVRRDCFLGSPRKDLQSDVGFVGATGYHPEYPFRGQLIEFLKAVYGERFRVFQGFRGNDLNDLYASIAVCVGDSCFGGADKYWSDRVPETLGRGGFLLHPACAGLNIPGLVTFQPGNLHELQDKIDYFLENAGQREKLRRSAHEWVRDWETYHNRMETLLRTVGLG